MKRNGVGTMPPMFGHRARAVAQRRLDAHRTLPCGRTAEVVVPAIVVEIVGEVVAHTGAVVGRDGDVAGVARGSGCRRGAAGRWVRVLAAVRVGMHVRGLEVHGGAVAAAAPPEGGLIMTVTLPHSSDPASTQTAISTSGSSCLAPSLACVVKTSSTTGKC